MAEEYKYIPSFANGINKNKRSDLIADLEVEDILNLRIDQDTLEVYKGYTLLSANLADGSATDGAYEELAKRLYRFEAADGTITLFLFTNAAVYTYNGSAWTLVTRDTTDEFTAVAGTDVITADSAHTLSDNDTVKFTTTDTLPAGLELDVIYYVINSSTPDFQVSLTRGGSTVDITDTGTGTHSFTPCYEGRIVLTVKAVTYTPLDAVVWTNGVDPPQIYISGALRDLAGLDDIAGAATEITACRDLAVWNEKLYMFYTTEDGEDIPQMIRWSDTADIEEWNNDGSNDGGFLRLSDRDDAIQTVAQLGPDLIVYRDHSIVKGQWVGSASRTATFDEIISDEGAIGPNAVANVGAVHIFFGWNNIFRYNGGTTLDPVGTKVRDLIYGPRKVIDLTKPVNISVEHITSLGEVWCSVLVGTTTSDAGEYTAYKTMILAYGVTGDNWTIREFGTSTSDVQIEGMLESQIVAFLHWNETELTWLEFEERPWNDQTFSSELPGILMPSGQNILNFDHDEEQDNGVDIPFRVDTKDFESGFNFIRIHYIDLVTLGSGCTVSYSIDKGTSWTILGTVGEHTTFSKNKMFANFSSQVVRWRVSGSGAGFKLGSFGFKFSIDTEY